MDLLDIKVDTQSVDRLKMAELRDAVRQLSDGASPVRDPQAAAMLSLLTDAQITDMFSGWEGGSPFPFRAGPEFLTILAAVVDSSGATGAFHEGVAHALPGSVKSLDLMKLIIQRECLRRLGTIGRELCGIRVESTAQLIQTASIAQLSYAMSRYTGPSIYPLAEGRGLIIVLASALGMAVDEVALRIARATLRTAA